MAKIELVTQVDEVFRDYSFSDKVTGLVAALGWKRPVLPQSMYIFKQPLIGGEVTSHQDSLGVAIETVGADSIIALRRSRFLL